MFFGEKVYKDLNEILFIIRQNVIKKIKWR
jgi:hypothetical protein